MIIKNLIIYKVLFTRGIGVYGTNMRIVIDSEVAILHLSFKK